MLTIIFAGAGNVMIPSNFVCAILTFAWPFARTKASLTVIAVIYGCAPLLSHCQSHFPSHCHLSPLPHPPFPLSLSPTPCFLTAYLLTP